MKRETRFTSKRPVNEIISKIEEAASPLGFDVKKNNFKVLNNHFLSLLTLFFISKFRWDNYYQLFFHPEFTIAASLWQC